MDKFKPMFRSLSRKFHNKLVRRKNKGNNNNISFRGAKLQNVIFEIEGSNNTITIQQDCFLRSIRFFIRGDNHSIFISRGVKFYHGGVIWFEDSDCSLEIGKDTTFECVHIAVSEPGKRVKIGEDCMFAYDIDLRTGDSHSIIDCQTQERLNFAKDIEIGNHVWVATRCLILKGAKVADNSVIASGSIVTKSFSEPGVVIAGNPAKVVKEGITWSRDRVYPQ